MRALAVEQAIGVALEELAALEKTDPLVQPRALATLRAALESELERAAGEGPLTGWTAESLSRMLVDGEGPRDPGHPVFAAFEGVEHARVRTATETGRVALLTRTGVRAIVDADARVRSALVEDVRHSGVLVPMTEANGLMLLRSADGTAYVVSFTDGALCDEWADAEAPGVSLRVTVATLAALRTHVQAAGAAGIVVNPRNESLLIPWFESPSAQIGAHRPVSFGVPAHVQAHVVHAVSVTAERIPGIRSVRLAAVTEGADGTRLTAVVDAADADVAQFVRNIAPLLSPSDEVDVLASGTALGEAIARDVPPSFLRETTSEKI